MAISDLYNALIGTVGNEQDYLAQDPYYSAGTNILRMQLPRATSNMEAILGPIAQGLIGGYLTGEGKRDATQAQYDAYRTNPMIRALGEQTDYFKDPNFIGPVSPTEVNDALLHDYTSATAPEGWTPKIGKTDLLLGTITSEAAKEAEMKKQAAQDELAAQIQLKTDPKIRDAEITDYIAKARGAANIDAETKGLNALTTSPDPITSEIYSKVPYEQRKDAIKEKGTIDKLSDGYKRIDELMGKGAIAAKDASTLLPGSVLGIDIPTSESKKVLDTVSAGITSVALSVWKGPLDEKDAKRILDPYLPTRNDTVETLKQKTEGLKQLLAQNAESTPILEGFGIGSRKPIASAPPTPPAGFELTGRQDANGNWGIRKKK